MPSFSHIPLSHNESVATLLAPVPNVKSLLASARFGTVCDI